MKSEKKLVKELLKYLKGIRKNCKKYKVFGEYTDDEGNEYEVLNQFDTKENCYEYWCEVEAIIREARYERLTVDPEILEYCKEDYEDEWDDMDEDERYDALDQFVIENYCSYEDTRQEIDLIWFNQIELINELIHDIKMEWNKVFKAIYQIDDKLITFTNTHTGVKRTGLILEEPSWYVLDDLSYDKREKSFTLGNPEYKVKCLIDGRVDWICLYEIKLDKFRLDEAGELDYLFDWRQ